MSNLNLTLSKRCHVENELCQTEVILRLNYVNEMSFWNISMSKPAISSMYTVKNNHVKFTRNHPEGWEGEDRVRVRLGGRR